MNLSKIGFGADTSDVRKATADLQKIAPAADKAAKSADNFSRAATGMGAAGRTTAGGVRSFDAAVSGATAKTGALSRSALATGTAMRTVQTAAAGTASSFNLVSAGAERQITRMDILSAKWQVFLERLRGTPPAAAGATSSLNRLGAAANDNINRLQATPGNIAAQFQDIGVTAAGGMNPMLIALQQGTQLSAAMSGGLGNLIAGFRQLFSVTTVLTVALVAMGAALLQSIDWASLGERVLNALADAAETASVAVAYLGVVLAIAFAPQIVAGIARVTAMIAGGLVTALRTATAASLTFAAANPFGFIVLAIGAVIGAMYLLNDTFGGVFTDALNWVKRAANFIIGALVGAFNSVKATWRMLPAAIGDFVMQVVNAVIRGVELMLNVSIALMNRLTSMLPFGLGDDLQMDFVSGNEFNNPFAGTLVETDAIIAREMAAARGADYIQHFVEGARSMGAWAANQLRGLLTSAAAGEDGAGSVSGGQAREIDRIAQAYQSLIEQTEARITAVQTETNAMMMSEHAARRYRNEQSLLAQAMAQNIPLTDQVIDQLTTLAGQLSDAELRQEIVGATRAFEEQMRVLEDQAALIGLTGAALEMAETRQRLLNDAIAAGIPITDEYNRVLGERAAALTGQSQGNSRAQFMADATQAHNERTFALSRERGELNLAGVALEAYRIETEMLVDAMREGIELGPEQIQLLRQQATEQANLTETIRRQREQLDFSRESFNGFFEDMIGGLRQGRSVWESFGDAIENIVNRIFDKLLELVLSDAFAAFTGNGQGGNLSGFFSSGGFTGGSGGGGLFGALSGLLGLFGGGSGVGAAAGAGAGGVGAAFGALGFAKGGVFTNGIYDSPTMFKFANGGAFGVMGEAGAEAVMPLKRGPDGSLGVQMNGPQVVQVVVTTNDDRFDAYVDRRVESGIEGAAPQLINASSTVSGNQTAFNNSRRVSTGGR